MSKDSSKPSRIDTLIRSVRSRRPDWSEALLGDSGLKSRAIDVLATPRLGIGLLIAIIFTVSCALTLELTRRQPLVSVNRIMNDTRLVRVKVTSLDLIQTAQMREQARQATPRVFVPDETLIDTICTSIETLPRQIAGVSALEELPESLRKTFNISAEAFDALRQESVDGAPTVAWSQRVAALGPALLRQIWLDRQTWQLQGQEGSSSNVKVLIAGAPTLLFKRDLVNIEDERMLSDAAIDAARIAGFNGVLRAVVVSRLTTEPKPLFTYDAAATAQDQKIAAEQIAPVIVASPPGQVIFQRGEKLTQSQEELYSREIGEHRESLSSLHVFLEVLGIVAVCCGITLALAGYTALFCRRAWMKASRLGGIALVLLVGLWISCFFSARKPEFMPVFATVPSVLTCMLLTIAYDRRSALAYGLLHSVLVCIALRSDFGVLVVTVTGIGCVVWTLREVRDRTTLVRTSLAGAAGVGLSTIFMGLIERPPVQGVGAEILTDAALASAAVILGGGVTLFLLPLIERVFGVTTGMTLIELRDSKQPLLRELQMRAPGTYNHSLTVASIAEAAAEAIQADSLLAYVGALYHDVGKMNKPEYFVENQTGGPNKHDKLSPAMSLLLVVGHVKDGLELAREFKLPRSIQHFIESHHGTTLVEFFYHRAKRRAQDESVDENEETQIPDEFEYRYHGPKPRTREAAILMIADAVESATRAMSDPSHSRIEALVRTIANKRLMDGQFDDCEITLKDLNVICESISRTVASMYHGRIAYPGGVEAQRA